MQEVTIDNSLNNGNYRILFKGIWTGVLISLIFHQLISH